MKKIINYETHIRLKISDYKEDVTWGDMLKSSSSINEKDIIINIGWNEEKVTGFGMGMNDDEKYQYVLYLTVKRSREETDEEYVERLKREESEKKRIDIQEYQTYLRLRGKYESQR